MHRRQVGGFLFVLQGPRDPGFLLFDTGVAMFGLANRPIVMPATFMGGKGITGKTGWLMTPGIATGTRHCGAAATAAGNIDNGGASEPRCAVT
jgi:hypothetical protein